MKDFCANFKKFIITHPRLICVSGVLALFSGLIVIYCRPILTSLHYLGDNDWDFYSFLYQYWHISFFSFKQFPLWNPYVCGGMTYVGRANPIFSPIIFFVLAFGVIAGLRLVFLFYLFAGMAGMFCLCRYLGIKNLAALTSSIIFGMSGYFAVRFVAGHVGFFSAAYLPWVFLFYLKGMKKMLWLFVAAAFLSLIACADFAYTLVFTSLFLIMFGLFYAIQQKTLRPIVALGVIFIFCLLFSGSKLFPALEMMHGHPRPTVLTGTFPIKSLYYFFWERTQDANFVDRMAFMRPTEWWDFGAYVGIVPVILFLLSMKFFKERWPLILTGVVVLLIAFGNFSDYAPWTLLHELPVFRNMHIPTRIFFVFIFILALLCGFTLNAFKPKNQRQRWAERIILSGLFCFIAWDLIVVNAAVFHWAFSPVKAEQPLVFKNQPFRQITMSKQENRAYGGTTALLMALLDNKGVVNGYESIPVRRKARADNHRSYQGEFYLLNNSGPLAQTYWSPNKFVFHYKIHRPDVLIINQNYNRHWRTKPRLEVRSFQGLLSVTLPPGENEITFYYVPLWFFIGLLTGLFGLFMVVVLVKKNINWKRSADDRFW